MEVEPVLPVADLSDQAVLITGAGRGLGRAIALRLAQRGSRVGLIDLDAAGCNAVAEQIRTAGGQATAFTADVADQSSVLGAAAEFAREHGGIDAIINNAMLLRYEPVTAITDAVADQMLGIGIKGALWGTQALLAHRRGDRSVAIINMTSPVAERGYPNTVLYSLVKGALSTLTKTLAAELGPSGVRVNALAPGSVPTPGALALNTQAEYERRSRTIPLRRLGHEDDVSDATEFLLSPAAAFINGEILHVDGGIAAAG
jgi:meso-butanediol dehydrogenase / (S,S)-butanediol dehydrogenase / diacetyl reductase